MEIDVVNIIIYAAFVIAFSIIASFILYKFSYLSDRLTVCHSDEPRSDRIWKLYSIYLSICLVMFFSILISIATIFHTIVWDMIFAYWTGASVLPLITRIMATTRLGFWNQNRLESNLERVRNSMSSVIYILIIYLATQVVYGLTHRAEYEKILTDINFSGMEIGIFVACVLLYPALLATVGEFFRWLVFFVTTKDDLLNERIKIPTIRPQTKK